MIKLDFLYSVKYITINHINFSSKDYIEDINSRCQTVQVNVLVGAPHRFLIEKTIHILRFLNNIETYQDKKFIVRL